MHSTRRIMDCFRNDRTDVGVFESTSGGRAEKSRGYRLVVDYRQMNMQTDHIPGAPICHV